MKTLERHPCQLLRLDPVHHIDHKFGAWFHILNQEGKHLGNIKSPLGKTDYHTMGTCWDILNVNEQNML